MRLDLQCDFQNQTVLCRPVLGRESGRESGHVRGQLVRHLVRLLLVVTTTFAAGVLHAAAPARLDEIKVEYRISRVQGLLDFALALAGEPHQAPALKEIFERSTFNNDETEKIIARIGAIRSRLYNGFDFDSGVASRSSSALVLNQLVTQSLYSNDLRDLSQRSLGLLAMSQHLQFFSDLRRLESVYNSLIWQKSSSELQAHQTKLRNLGQKVGLDQMFSRAETFYRGNWPKDLPFTIGLYAVPYLKGFQNTTTSHSIGSIEEHGVLIGGSNEDLPGSFGVVFHELCHSLYDSQSPAFMKEFESYFLNTSSPYKAYKMQAYLWINEALATAIGNGWAYSRANNSTLEKNTWYDNPIIDGFARGLYPMVSSYLKDNRPIDRSFVEHAISLFAQRFPEAIYAYQNLFNKIVFLKEDGFLTNNDARDALRQAFLVSSFSGNSPINHPRSIQSAQHDDASMIVMVSPTDAGEFQKLSAEFPYLKANLKIIAAMKNRTYFAGLDKNGRLYVVIKAASSEEFFEAVEALKNNARVDLKNVVKEY
jgi:hypothetical protein